MTTATAAPSVKSVFPDIGTSAGGATVTVTGSGFSNASEVLFGTVAGGEVHVVSGGQLTVVAPVHAAGNVHVRVVTKTSGTTRTSVAAIRDRYIYHNTGKGHRHASIPAPVVTAISPASGPDTGGTTVTVTGSGFTKLTKVAFGAVDGTAVKVLSAATLTVTAPAGSAGAVDVRVTGAYGTSPATSRDQYTYLDTTPPPPVTGLAAAGATSSTITLSWTNPAGSDYAGATIRRAEGSTPPATPTSGTAVTDVAAPASTWTDTGLDAGTTYSYALFAHNQNGNDAPAVTVTGTTTATPTCAPSVQRVSGTLTADTTWAPDCTTAYVIGSSLNIPAGITLTIAPGTVVKLGSAASDVGSGLNVAPGGTLTVSGSSSSPVVFTSLEDDSAGGDTNGDGAVTSGAAGQYGTAIHLDTGDPARGPSVSVDYAVFRDGTDAISDTFSSCCTATWSGAGTLTVSHSDIAEAISIGGETATDIFNSDTIHDTTTGLTVGRGTVSFRGTFSHVTHAITACNWGAGCTVDATYTDWGDGADGPFPQGASPMVCGAVLVSPWTGENGTSPTAFGSGNCDKSDPAPDRQLNTATQQFTEDLAGVQVQCDDGYQDFCAQAQTALTCLSAAEGAAEANSPIPLTDEQTAEQFASIANDKLSPFTPGGVVAAA